ncbi:MAG: hypothetical protein JRF33_12530 [Deltaproteobacteria bacterium]|nr:hypothetical protein [Deltaproteobacteria bacterium]
MWYEDVLNLSEDLRTDLSKLLLSHEQPDIAPRASERFQAEEEADALLKKLARQQKDDDYVLFLLALVQIKFRFEFKLAHKILKKLCDKHTLPYLKFIYGFALLSDFEQGKAAKLFTSLIEEGTTDYRFYYLAGISLSPNEATFKKSVPGFDYLQRARELCDDEGYKNEIIFKMLLHASYYDEEDFRSKPRTNETTRVWSETLQLIEQLLSVSEEGYGYAYSYIADIHKKMGDMDKAGEAREKFEKHCSAEHESATQKEIDSNVLILEADLSSVEKGMR